MQSITTNGKRELMLFSFLSQKHLNTKEPAPSFYEATKKILVPSSTLHQSSSEYCSILRNVEAANSVLMARLLRYLPSPVEKVGQQERFRIILQLMILYLITEIVVRLPIFLNG